jgi:hypothetical protein
MSGTKIQITRLAGRDPPLKGNAMSILSSLNQIADEFRAARTRYLTERAIRSLPMELQKDIGYPEAFDRATGRRGRASTFVSAR